VNQHGEGSEEKIRRRKRGQAYTEAPRREKNSAERIRTRSSSDPEAIQLAFVDGRKQELSFVSKGPGPRAGLGDGTTKPGAEKPAAAIPEERWG